MKDFIKRTPVIGPLARLIASRLNSPDDSFHGSQDYWERRYKSGGNSGAGSYNKLAEFKASVINSFVKEMGVKTVIEFGSGDGNQLKLANYPSYIGFDVSAEAISRCKNIFLNDGKKKFKLMDKYSSEKAELTLSLDVIYHLIEDRVYLNYMRRLFESSERFVIIYSSDTDKQTEQQVEHVRQRCFSKLIHQEMSNWKLIKHIPNKYPYADNPTEGSIADFYIYRRI